jgi:hypothetical protein
VRTHTDEWGGYSKPNWTTLQKQMSDPIEEVGRHRGPGQRDSLFDFDNFLDTKEDESLCKLVGIDIEKRLQEILSKEKSFAKREELNYQKFQKVPPNQP